MWPQIVFRVDREQVEPLENALFEAGALSVILKDQQDQPVLEPLPGEIRLWDLVILTGLFAMETSPADIISALQAEVGPSLPPYEFVPLADQQWERVWMKDFRPMQFGPSLWICPTHMDPVEPDAVNVRLDPGLAFGTGTHATTRQCLEWIGANEVTSQLIVDYGCGSGVLAVAAAMCGAGKVVGIDIDSQAHLATRENAALNGVADRIELVADDDVQAATADTILANILYQPLMTLGESFAAIAKPGGSLVMSGLLVEQTDSISVLYNQWFTLKESRQQDGWALLWFVRNTS